MKPTKHNEFVLVCILPPSLDEVVISFNTGFKEINFLVDGVKQGDSATDPNEPDGGVFRAYTAMLEKFGIGRGNIQMLFKVHQRYWYDHNVEQSYTEHLFFAILKSKQELPSRAPKESRLIERRFVPFYKVFHLWNKVPRAPNRLNSYHAIAFVQCIQKLQELTENDSKFVAFERTIDDLFRIHNIDLGSLIQELQDLIQLWKGERSIKIT